MARIVGAGMETVSLKEWELFEKNARKAVQMAENAVMARIPVQIKLSFYRGMKGHPAWTGCYVRSKNTVYISPYLVKKEISAKVYAKKRSTMIKETVLHELGHAVHFEYFQGKPQYLRRKHKGDTDYYCNSNHRESFAECFKDYVLAVENKKEKKIEKSKRLSKMRKLLMELDRRIS